ncbi:hypothetical protein LCGC14_1499430 [marine sediment metagenome]|uniref:Uncharacterized protein n=1 Tax=marine sediment metagenome TaxID=412755 RepID=A0A0F9LK49_9ZZZZ|nr:hypothetical protein [Candidatus Scalindua sp.]
MTNNCIHIKPVFGMRGKRHFDKSVHCEDCKSILDYEIGSIAWECKENDLCPECSASRSVKRIFDKLKREREDD